MAGIKIGKATPEDFELVLGVLRPLDAMFNCRWGYGCDVWLDWDEDDPDYEELVAIRRRVAREEHVDEDDVDNRLVVAEFVASRMRAAGAGSWERVVLNCQALIDTFCDPADSCLSWHPFLERCVEDQMLGE